MKQVAIRPKPISWRWLKASNYATIQ